MNRLKRYLVRRWLHLIPATELFTYARDRKDYEQFNKFYQDMADKMINLHFKAGTQVNDLELKDE